MSKKLKYSLLYLFSVCVSFAQIGQDSLVHSPLAFSGKGINSHFEKHLNIYNLRSLITYNLSGENYFVGLKEDFGSTIIQSANKNIKDEHYFSFLGEYKLNNLIKAGFTLNNDIYSDNRSLAINQVSVTHSKIYAAITPYKKILLIPFAGLSNNQQIGEKDAGYIYGAEFEIDSLLINEFNIHSMGRFINEDISPRKNLSRIATINLSNRFENTLLNNLSASYSEQRKDFYLDADSSLATRFNISNNIQSRTENNYYIQDQLVFIPERSRFMFFLFGRLDWRNIDRDTRYRLTENISTNSFDTDIEEHKINFITSLRYNYKSFSAQLRVSFLEREEKHSAKRIEGANEIYYDRRSELEFQKNNKSQQTTLSLSGNLNLSTRDQIILSVLHRKLVYNTPSDENYDDRDELLTIFELEYRRKINALMNIFMKVDGSLNHVVYIFAERSSNNNIRRVLSFTSGVSFEGKRFRNTLSASVMADYTVYDFKEYNPFLQNFSFRRFSVSDSSVFNFNRNFVFNFEGYLRLSEQGDFDWTNFSNRPSRYLQEIYVEPVLAYNYKILTFGAGLKYFSLSTYGYDEGEKVKQTEYTSIGPLVEVRAKASKNLYVSLLGWYEFIKTEGNKGREIANFNLRLNWNL